ncbi:hypothetical protein D3C73_1348970 [compost metagenome]
MSAADIQLAGDFLQPVAAGSFSTVRTGSGFIAAGAVAVCPAQQALDLPGDQMGRLPLLAAASLRRLLREMTLDTLHNIQHL